MTLDNQVYEPLAVRLGSINSRQSKIVSLNMLHDAMLFESLLAAMLMLQNPAFNTKERVSKGVLFHSNNSMAELRKRLSTLDTGTSDEVIMTIVTHAVIQVCIQSCSMYLQR
jgi:hypothetical protein